MPSRSDITNVTSSIITICFYRLGVLKVTTMWRSSVSRPINVCPEFFWTDHYTKHPLGKKMHALCTIHHRLLLKFLMRKTTSNRDCAHQRIHTLIFAVCLFFLADVVAAFSITASPTPVRAEEAIENIHATRIVE